MDYGNIVIHKPLEHLGTFQISDLTYNTLGGAVGGAIYYLGYCRKRKNKTKNRGKLTKEIIDTMIDTVYVYDKKRIEVILRFDDVLQKVISEYMEGAKGA